jgi:hypothetical protein
VLCESALERGIYMTDITTDDAATEDEQPPVLESILVPHEDAPDELTIFPATLPPEMLITHWITAPTDVVADLEEWR